MFNKVILVGNLTRDVDLKYLPSGTAIAALALATSRKFKDSNGNDKEEVCFIDISFFGRTAEIANQYLKKGSKILVEGRLKLDQWVDNTGNKRSKHSIIAESMKMLDTKSESYSTNNYDTPYQKDKGGNYNSNVETGNIKEEKIPDINIEEDEIPF